MPFLAYYHSSLRWALRHMTAPEFKVYTYLISIVIRPKKSDISKYTRGIEVYNIYMKGRMLVVNVSIGRIAKECKLGERTVAKAMKRFSDAGILIKITSHKGRYNHIYLVGIENMWPENKEYKGEYYFTEFKSIQDGNALPDAVRDFIIANKYDAEKLARNGIPELNVKLRDLFVDAYNKKKDDDVVRLWNVRG